MYAYNYIVIYIHIGYMLCRDSVALITVYITDWANATPKFFEEFSNFLQFLINRRDGQQLILGF